MNTWPPLSLTARRIGLLAGCLLLLIVSAPTVAEPEPRQSVMTAVDAPVAVVFAGVTDFDLVPPKLFYHDGRYCPPDVPGRAGGASDHNEDREIISRIPSYGGFLRILFTRHNDHEEGECSTYEIHSNVVADEEYIYWADDSGLVRLSVEANLGDAPEVVHQHIVSTSNEQPIHLTLGDEYIYAAVHDAKLGEADRTTIYAVNKAFKFWREIVTVNHAHRLSYDGYYLYWLDNAFLWKAYPTPGNSDSYSLQSIAFGVTAYYAEGNRRCLDDCPWFVFIAKGDHVVRYSNLTGNTTQPIYQSDGTEELIRIFDLVSAEHLFIREGRAEPCADICLEQPYNQLLIRTGRAGGPWELIDQVPDTPLPDYNRLNTSIMTDWDFLYWLHQGAILRLPNNAAALPLTNLTIDDIQVTQGIQDLNNSVDLIAGRRTFVRVFGRSDEDYVHGVTAHLYRLNPVTLEAIDGPLIPINAAGPNLTVYPAPMITDVETSFLFELPFEWVEGDLPLKLRAEINPFNVPLEKAEDRFDNTVTINSPFALMPSPRLDIQFYVLSYTASNGNTYTPDMSLDVNQTFSWLRRVYPLANMDSGNGGLQPTVKPLFMPELASRIEQIHPACLLMGDDKSMCASTYVNALLGVWRSAAGNGDIYFGLYHDGSGLAAFPRGRGSFGVASGPAGDFCCGSANWDEDNRYTDWYTGHELGHALGRDHPVAASNNCGHTADDPSFPYPQAWIGGPTMQGFDGGDPAFGIPRAVLTSTNWHDLMSYCDRQWISDYTYWGIYNLLHALPSATRETDESPRAAEADQLAVYGTILPETGVALLHHVRRTSDPLDAPPLIPGAYSIRLLNAQGNELADYPFTPVDAGESAAPLLDFGQVVGFAPGTASIQIVAAGGDVLAEALISPNPPVVGNVALVDAPQPVSGIVTLEWAASDADGDALSFDVLYSGDGGNAFQPIQLGVIGTTAEIDTGALAGGQAVLRVIASDGVLSDRADSAPFDVALKPPQARILSPGNNQSSQWGQLVQFIGEATDPQDGILPADALTWTINGERLGLGPVVSRERLPVGANVIELTALNSHGLSAKTTITIFVHDHLTFAGPTLSVSPANVGWHVPPRTTEEQTATLIVTNLGTGSFDWTAASSAAWLEVRRNGPDLPAEIYLTADPRQIAAGASLSAVVRVEAEGSDGSMQTAEIPVTLSSGNVWLGDPLGENGRKLYLPITLRLEPRE